MVNGCNGEGTWPYFTQRVTASEHGRQAPYDFFLFSVSRTPIQGRAPVIYASCTMLADDVFTHLGKAAVFLPETAASPAERTSALMSLKHAFFCLLVFEI